MKLKTIIAASTLAATGVVGAASQSASAICGVELELHNLSANDVTVDFADSDVRRFVSVFGVQVPGPWTALGNYSTVVGAGDVINAGFFPSGPCGVDRGYRLEVTDGGSTYFVYFPGPLGGTTDRTPVINVA
jgi:hypothetical protein